MAATMPLVGSYSLDWGSQVASTSLTAGGVSEFCPWLFHIYTETKPKRKKKNALKPTRLAFEKSLEPSHSVLYIVLKEKNVIVFYIAFAETTLFQCFMHFKL